MKILGRALVAPFDEFWESLGVETEIPTALIEQGHRSVFGADSYHPSPGVLPHWMNLPDAALSYHVAHELMHVVLRRRGYPTPLRGKSYTSESEEARVCGDIEEMIDHPSIESLLLPFPFDRTHIQQHLFKGAEQGLSESPVPEIGSLWWTTWACRFCELYFLLPYGDWLTLEEAYNRKCPAIAERGRDMMRIFSEEGYNNPSDALRTMVKCRDILGLEVTQQCIVFDPISGHHY